MNYNYKVTDEQGSIVSSGHCAGRTLDHVLKLLSRYEVKKCERNFKVRSNWSYIATTAQGTLNVEVV